MARFFSPKIKLDLSSPFLTATISAKIEAEDETLEQFQTELRHAAARLMGFKNNPSDLLAGHVELVIDECQMFQLAGKDRTVRIPWTYSREESAFWALHDPDDKHSAAQVSVNWEGMLLPGADFLREMERSDVAHSEDFTK